MFSNKSSLAKPEVKKKKKRILDYFDFKNNHTNRVGLVLFSAFVIATSLHYFFENRFDETRWKEHKMRRYKMLDDIMERDLFINETKQEIVKKLGKPSESYSGTIDLYNYYIGEAARYPNNQIKQLSLFFENNRVSKVAITPRAD